METLKNISLGKYTGFGCGPNASELVKVDNVLELKNLMKRLMKKNLTWYLIGGGSNTLAVGEKFRGTVVKLSGEFQKIKVEQNRIYAGAGAVLSEVLKTARNFSLSGVEFLAGIPGTVGGGIAGNCGNGDKNIGDKIDFIEVLNCRNFNIRRVGKSDLNFNYRSFNVFDNLKKSKSIITGAGFCLKTKNKTDIISKIDQNIEIKRKKQPLDFKSCGCVFKNPTGDSRSAGELIENAGLKGFKKGGAKISKVHANYIVNCGTASPDDILFIIKRVKEEIKKKFKLELELEINIMGNSVNNGKL